MECLGVSGLPVVVFALHPEPFVCQNALVVHVLGGSLTSQAHVKTFSCGYGCFNCECFLASHVVHECMNACQKLAMK